MFLCNLFTTEGLGDMASVTTMIYILFISGARRAASLASCTCAFLWNVSVGRVLGAAYTVLEQV